MKRTKYQNQILILIIAGVSFTGCKKIDLIRIAHVKTGTVSNISQNSATATATIVDLGDGGVRDHGFCWSLSTVSNAPTKSNFYVGVGTATKLGEYSSTISNLAPNSEYRIRSYIEDGNGIQYGESKTFLTPAGGGAGFWLKYDDGSNYTGIGLTDGSNFDYAIRFPVQVLANYDGYRISKIRFFPREAANFYIEVFEGSNPPALVYYEPVNNPILNAWNEYTPTNTYYINKNIEIWVGVWVTNYFAGTFPAGVDDGPAIAGAGDMISFDDGLSWQSLYSSNSALNYNWNLQVYITNQKGEQVLLMNSNEMITKQGTYSKNKGSIKQVVSEKSIN